MCSFLLLVSLFSVHQKNTPRFVKTPLDLESPFVLSKFYNVTKLCNANYDFVSTLEKDMGHVNVFVDHKTSFKNMMRLGTNVDLTPFKKVEKKLHNFIKKYLVEKNNTNVFEWKFEGYPLPVKNDCNKEPGSWRCYFYKKIPIPEFITKRISYEGFTFRLQQHPFRFGMHYDCYDNILIQLHGSKRVVLFQKSQKHDHLTIDKLKQKQNAWEKNVQETTLHPGDVLFIPMRWFHSVETTGESMIHSSINFPVEHKHSNYRRKKYKCHQQFRRDYPKQYKYSVYNKNWN